MNCFGQMLYNFADITLDFVLKKSGFAEWVKVYFQMS